MQSPLQAVRDSCARVASQAVHVSLDDAAIEAYAASIHAVDGKILMEGVEWDASGWHYNLDADSGGDRTCQYIFVMDALNFCFWPSPGFEYDTLAVSLKHRLEANPNAFDASQLVNITAEELSSWFPAHLPLPQVEERVLRVQELGAALLEDFDGLAANMVRKAQGSAVRLVQLMLKHVTGFRDTSIYRGRLVHLYKRVQILVGDVWAAYGRRTAPRNAADPFYFTDVDQLTMFADYRVPQILRALSVMKYSAELSAAIDAQEEIACGSPEEVEIRACTVVAVDRLQQALRRRGLNLLVVEVDWLLWQRGEAAKDSILPHHRTSTIYY
jgi:hypothetical protein